MTWEFKEAERLWREEPSLSAKAIAARVLCRAEVALREGREGDAADLVAQAEKITGTA
jgi:hypothetical protein